ADESIRVVSRRDENAAPEQPRLKKNSERSQGGFAARIIAIEARDYVLGVSSQQTQLLDRQGRAATRNRFLKAGLRQRYRIDVTFDEDRAIFGRDGGSSFIQSVDGSRLRIEGRLGRVQILGLAIIEHPAAEGHHPALYVADGKHQAGAEH